jgi:hypothetical protein
MDAPFASFPENKLSVITYNYDRSLEQFLFTALKHTHGKSDEECAEVTAAIPIIHLHGWLGPIHGERGKTVPYESDTELSPLKVKYCAQNIRIISEPIDIDKDTAFTRAREAIRQARRLAFLGFGFNETNLERLRLKGLMAKPANVFASTYGLGKADIAAVERYLLPCFPSLSGVYLGRADQDINGVLRDFPVMDFL